MGTGKLNKDREQELRYADEVIQEVRNTGQTLKRCPRCGAKLLVYDAGSGYRVQCERDQCFLVTVRGL